MSGCQNCGPFLGTLHIRCRIRIRVQKGTITLTTTQMIPTLGPKVYKCYLHWAIFNPKPSNPKRLLAKPGCIVGVEWLLPLTAASLCKCLDGGKTCRTRRRGLGFVFSLTPQTFTSALGGRGNWFVSTFIAPAPKLAPSAFDKDR